MTIAPGRAARRRTWVFVAGLFIATGFSAAAVGVGPLVAGSPSSPPVFEPTPSAVLFGDGELRVATLRGVHRLNGDDAHDLIVHQQPDGMVSRQAMYAIAGRATWPRAARLTSLGATEIKPPAGRATDSVLVVGAGDLNGDGRIDIAATRTQFPGPSAVPREVYIYFGPEGPIGGSYRSPEVTVSLPEPTRGIAVAMADIDGDGLAELLLMDENSTRVLPGRVEWPARVEVDPLTTFTTGIDEILVADVTADGIDDLILNLYSAPADVALLPGRPEWAPEYDVVAAAAWTMGAGRGLVRARFVADVSGDGIDDVAVVDSDLFQLQVFHGGADMGRGLPAPDWAISSVDLTGRDVEVAHLTGSGLADVLVNRLAVYFGRPLRTGIYDTESDDADAHWPLPQGEQFFTGDVDGDGQPDVLLSDPSARGQSRESGAGAIRIYKGPVLPTPEVSPTPRPSLTPTPTATASPTSLPTEPTRSTGEAAVFLPWSER